jgi:hypothetical protein
MFNRFLRGRTPCTVYSFNKIHWLFLHLVCIDPLRLVLQALNKNTQNTINLFCFQTFAAFWILYSFFWVFPRRLNFICRRFEILCSIFIGDVSTPPSSSPMKIKHSVPKSRHIKFRRREITQKKEYKMRILFAILYPINARFLYL